MAIQKIPPPQTLVTGCRYTTTGYCLNLPSFTALPLRFKGVNLKYHKAKKRACRGVISVYYPAKKSMVKVLVKAGQ
jgi:hypothetical protein